MSKIGKKLIISYFFIIAFSSLAILSIIRVDFQNNINEKIKSDIRNDALNISKQMEADLEIFEILDRNKDGGTVRDIFPSDAAFKYSVRFASTNIFILNQRRVLVYESWKDDINPFDLYGNLKPNLEYFSAESSIKNGNGEIVGYVVTMAKKEDVSKINEMLMEASVLGVIISVLIAIIISLFFEKKITNPIKKLRRNINNFKITNEFEWEEINTRDEISELNDDFRKMTNNLVKNDKQQKEFFQNSSHELKTPLMSIRSYAEAIKDKIVQEEDIDTFLDVIIDESNKLNLMVNNIMYMSKIDSFDEISHEKIEISEIIDEISSRFYVYANEKNIEIIYNVDNDTNFSIKEEQMFMILSNLISNSLRYAREKIYVNIYRDDNRSFIEIYDDGLGFDENEIDRVFDRFFKGEKGLSGLGLSIVQGIVKNNNGKVKAYNKEGFGACILIEFISD